MERFSASDANSAADAQRYAQTDTTLLKARLLTEYGLYDKALAALDGYRPDSATAIEYHFRRGRICQLKGLDAQAIEHYDKAIAQATADKRFHGPYAALYAAQSRDRRHDCRLSIPRQGRAPQQWRISEGHRAAHITAAQKGRRQMTPASV